jgi:predicted RNase H-like HicB family nuclease
MMRYLIVLEPTQTGFAVQVPDLAISTYGRTIDAARRAACKAIKINLEAYRQEGKAVPKRKPAATHLKNPDFAGCLFTYVEMIRSPTRKPALV